MRVTVTETKNRFGSLSVKTNHDKSALAARKEKFEKEFGDWIDVQNSHCETHGIPGADLRPW